MARPDEWTAMTIDGREGGVSDDAHRPPSRATMAIKRLMDIVGSAAGLVILSPVMAVTALLVLARMGRPVLFRQERPGLDARPFTMLKFRTMVAQEGRDGDLSADAQRVTALGRKLRSASLDELPELWNVLKGDMSLVGPRPLLVRYLPLYSAEQRRRHEVRPGLTGWAQINGRNSISWDTKFAHDVWYVDHLSIWLDLKILWSTIFKVASAHGVSPESRDIMPEFLGTSSRNDEP